MPVRMPVLRLVARLQLITLFGLAASLALSGVAGAAVAFNTLYTFAASPDGSAPYAGLISDASGNFYGTTEFGGNANTADCNNLGCGTVFELNSEPERRLDRDSAVPVLLAKQLRRRRQPRCWFDHG